MRSYLGYEKVTLEDEGLHLIFDKSFESSFAFSFFLFEAFEALVELSLGGLHPSLDCSPALLFLVFLVVEFVLDGSDHLQDLAIPSLFDLGALQYLFLCVIELVDEGLLLLRFVDFCCFLQILQFLEELRRPFAVFICGPDFLVGGEAADSTHVLWKMI